MTADQLADLFDDNDEDILVEATNPSSNANNFGDSDDDMPTMTPGKRRTTAILDDDDDESRGFIFYHIDYLEHSYGRSLFLQAIFLEILISDLHKSIIFSRFLSLSQFLAVQAFLGFAIYLAVYLF